MPQALGLFREKLFETLRAVPGWYVFGEQYRAIRARVIQDLVSKLSPGGGEILVANYLRVVPTGILDAKGPSTDRLLRRYILAFVPGFCEHTF